MAAAGAFLVSVVVGTVEMIGPVLVSKDAKTVGYIQAGLSIAGIGTGLFLAKKHPMLAVAVGAPSVASLVGSFLSAAIAKMITPTQVGPATTTTTPAPAATQKGMGALSRNLGALLSQQGAPRLGALHSNQGAPMLGAVFHENMGAVFANQGAVFHENMGDYGGGYMAGAVDTPPWSQGTPFG